MRPLLVVAMALMANVSLIAQKAPIKFGDVPIEQIQMKTYTQDSSASAVILADYGETTIEYNDNSGFQLVFERTTRIKILTKDGLQWGDFSIPLYKDNDASEKISGVKGVTYNLEDGKVVESKLKSDGQFKENYSSNLTYHKFTMPNVKEGSLIEVTYRIFSDFLFNFQDWEFQSTIPVVYSEYRANIPEYFGYEKYMQGYLRPSVNQESTSPRTLTITSKERTEGKVSTTTFTTDKIEFMQNNHRWVIENAPAFKAESYITTPRDYISKINFELAYTQYPYQPRNQIMGSWEQINKRYAESDDFGGAITGNGFLKKVTEDVCAGLSTEDEKLSAIHHYVRSNYAWDGAYRKFTESTLRKVFDEKTGNSAELNLLLGSMLEKLNIQVSPVLISTRNHGFVRENIPLSSQFNYTILLAKIGEKSYLLDATEKLLPLGMLPERCLNGKGLVISKAGYGWINLSAPIRSKQSYNVDGKLNADGGLEGKLSIERTGYFAERDRKKYLSKEEKEYVNELVNNHQLEIKSSQFDHSKELSKPFKELHEVIMPERATVAANTIYINPVFFNRLAENPFKAEERQYPVDFGSSFEQTYILKLTIPDGYAIDEMPQSKAMALPGGAGRFTYSSTLVGNTVSVINTLLINRSIFTQDEYPSLREFYSQIVSKQAEQIVVKKN